MESWLLKEMTECPNMLVGHRDPIKVERSSTLESLKRKVFEATGIDPLMHSLLLTCKYPIHGGSYRAVTLTNEEIVDCMLDESSMGGAIELYVDKETILRQASTAAMIEESAEPDMMIEKPDEGRLNRAQSCDLGGWDFSFARSETGPTNMSYAAHQTEISFSREESVKGNEPCILKASTGKLGDAVTPVRQKEHSLQDQQFTSSIEVSKERLAKTVLSYDVLASKTPGNDRPAQPSRIPRCQLFAVGASRYASSLRIAGEMASRDQHLPPAKRGDHHHIAGCIGVNRLGGRWPAGDNSSCRRRCRISVGYVERRHGRPIGNLMFYRRELDLADDRWVIWEPYPKSLHDKLPAICASERGVWRSRVPLIHFAIVEMHVPDRVMRQFGMQQCSTEDVETVERIDARGKPGVNWLEHHHAPIEKWGQRLQLVLTEEHKPELSSMEEHDRQTEECESHSMEDQEPAAHSTQSHLEQDLINLCCQLRGRLNEHLLACSKPSLVYKMLADIDHIFGLYGFHYMLSTSTRECNTNGPSSSSLRPSCSVPSKTNPDLQSSRKRPLLSSSSSSKPPLHPPAQASPAFSALPAMYLQNRHEQRKAQQSLSLVLQSSKVDESSSGGPGIGSLASPMKKGKGRGRRRGST